MTQTIPAPVSLEKLACGCPGHGHNPGCLLDTAEQISALAIATAAEQHPLIAALTALIEARLLRPMVDVDPLDYMLGLLDDLWSDGLLGPDGGQS